MRWPLVWRRRADADLAAVKAETQRMREHAEWHERQATRWRGSALTAARQFAEADEQLTATRIVNRSLTEELAAARKRLADALGDQKPKENAS